MQRLKSRAQFQAVLAGTTVAKSGHFVLHRLVLPADQLQASTSGNSLSMAATQKATASDAAPKGSRPPALPLFSNPGHWLGAMVPKRWAKRAVTRNMIKRRIYSLAENTNSTTNANRVNVAYVVRLRSAFDSHLFKSATSAPLRLAVSRELSGLFAQGFQHD